MIARLADKKMNMLGHYNIAQYSEPVMAAGQLKRMKEDVFADRIREVRGPTIATEGDKVIVAFMLITPETQWHVRNFIARQKIEEADRAFQRDGPHLPIKLADMGHPICVRFDQMWATRPTGGSAKKPWAGQRP